ncbi:MAG: hypothetical protein M1319_02150 [Chloroflexi bacterium]|nr:hypothetical protein [Chloroflexota bacterium]
MGKCTICGHKAGWGKSVCDPCEAAQEAAEQQQREAKRRYAVGLLHEIQAGNLIPLPRELRLPISLRAGERCYYCTGMCLYTVVDSLPKAEEARSRVNGPAAEWVSARKWHEVKFYDAGVLAITGGRLMFAGEKTTFNIYLDEIMSIRREQHEDGNLLAISACTLSQPLIFGYVDYWHDALDSIGEVFNSALQLTIQQLLQRRARMAG